MIHFTQRTFHRRIKLFQRSRSTLKTRLSDIENETECNVEFSTLFNVDTTLKQH